MRLLRRFLVRVQGPGLIPVRVLGGREGHGHILAGTVRKHHRVIGLEAIGLPQGAGDVQSEVDRANGYTGR